MTSSEAENSAFDGLHVLVHPGWLNSGPDHWQSRWEGRLGANGSRVQQRDWEKVTLADWMDGVEAAISAAPMPVLYVGHSLSCILAAHFATKPFAAKVKGAFLVAPTDVERPECPAETRVFGPIPKKRMPFPSLVVASDEDHYCPLDRARDFAEAWGARLHVLHDAGHINAASGYGEWPEGFAMLENFARQVKGGAA